MARNLAERTGRQVFRFHSRPNNFEDDCERVDDSIKKLNQNEPLIWDRVPIISAAIYGPLMWAGKEPLTVEESHWILKQLDLLVIYIRPDIDELFKRHEPSEGDDREYLAWLEVNLADIIVKYDSYFRYLEILRWP
jgi:hypothetical protein